ncbi:hypothetical protein NKI32_12280 [Mesorhizobium sp. M0761]|uniref:hypothetical protein n=1 Tax=Mesorhizobium sp. M0761 TaxID=2956994 RepID=UPI003337276E
MPRAFPRQTAKSYPGKRRDQCRQHRLERHDCPDFVAPADADQHRLQGVGSHQQHEKHVFAQIGLVSADHLRKQDDEQQGNDEWQGNENHDRKRGSKAADDGPGGRQ